jgi:hypothetical protein
MSDSTKVLRYACENGTCRVSRDSDITTYASINECQANCKGGEISDSKWYLGVFIVLFFASIISVYIKRSLKNKLN